MYQSSDTLAGQASTAAVAAMPHPCPAAAVDKDGSPMRCTGRQAIVTLPQHMDESNAGQIREKLLLVINCGATELIADLTQTDSCDHMGADAVACAYQRAAAAGTQLRLVVTAPAVHRVLTLNGLIPMYPSLAAAIAAGAAAAPVP
jgi:anti-anti-sigma factor